MTQRACLITALGIWTAPARAGNGGAPRTPVVFHDAPCVEIVDRSSDPIIHLDLGTPQEDTQLTDDELDDSRTFEIFALCRDVPITQNLPKWVLPGDAERARAAGLIDALPGPEEVLSTASAWSIGHDGAPGSCVHAFGDGARLPIRCSTLAEGVDWDTSAAPPGPYVIYGYTFEPPQSLWTGRLGVVVVTDSSPSALPGAAIVAPARGDTAYQSPGYPLRGCATGASGTSVELSWSYAAHDIDPASWQFFAAPALAADGTFTAIFSAPDPAIERNVLVRAVARDPEGDTWTTYSRHSLYILAGEGESVPGIPQGLDVCDDASTTGGETTAALPPDETTSGSAGSSHTGSDDGPGAPAGAPPVTTTCACDQGGDGAPSFGLGLALALALALVGRRRSRPQSKFIRGGRSPSTWTSSWTGPAPKRRVDDFRIERIADRAPKRALAAPVQGR
ncbi:MAG: hypothetical protein R3B09_15310 [Nannocystaceae bacterium]